MKQIDINTIEYHDGVRRQIGNVYLNKNTILPSNYKLFLGRDALVIMPVFFGKEDIAISTVYINGTILKNFNLTTEEFELEFNSSIFNVKFKNIINEMFTDTRAGIVEYNGCTLYTSTRTTVVPFDYIHPDCVYDTGIRRMNMLNWNSNAINTRRKCIVKYIGEEYNGSLLTRMDNIMDIQKTMCGAAGIKKVQKLIFPLLRVDVNDRHIVTPLPSTSTFRTYSTSSSTMSLNVLGSITYLY